MNFFNNDNASLAKELPNNRKDFSAVILVTAERLREYTNRICHVFGVTVQQYNILRILRDADPHALSCAEINSRMIQRSPDITRLLSRMEDMGLIVRSRDPSDNRIVRTAILEEGANLVASMAEMISSVDDVFDALTEEETESLHQVLSKVRLHINQRLGR
jgi:DNA-binding MarR family transcriptional regulator